MLVAAVQWSESAICVHISPLSWISLLPPAPQFHSCRSSESTELSSRVLYSSFPLAIYFGNPLQWSCLENPRDEEAWWAAIYGVVQSRTRLKRLSSSSSSIDNLKGSFAVKKVVKIKACMCMLICWLMSNSFQAHGLYPARLLHPCNFPSKNTGVGCHCLLSPTSFPDRLQSSV